MASLSHRLLPAFALVCAIMAPLPAFAGDASIDQVYSTAKAGDTQGALGMMDQVLKDHPNSAKAHYVEAELLARSNRLADARGELAKAESLAPGLPFASAHSVGELKRKLEGQPGAAVASPVQSGSHVPLSAIIVIAIGAFILLAALRRRTQNSYGVPMGGYGGGYNPQMGPQGPYGPGGGYGPGYGPGYGGGGMGSGILGGLAQGAAMGAGFAAGEEVVDHMFGGGRRERPASGGWDDSGGMGGDPNADMGGNDFGISDSGSWDGGGDSGGDGGW